MAPSAPLPGFTLLELLIVVAIIAVLAALAFPVYSRISESSKATQCVSNLRQLAALTQLYTSETGNLLPPNVPEKNSQKWSSILNQKFGGSLAEGYFDINANKKTIFNCPSIAPHGRYFGDNATYGRNHSIPTEMRVAAFQGSLSKTVLLADSVRLANDPKDNIQNWVFRTNAATNNAVHARHNGAANLLFLDGHVEAVSSLERFKEFGITAYADEDSNIIK